MTSSERERTLPSPGRHANALALDLGLAQRMRQLALAHGASEEAAQVLALTTTLLGQERGRGHSCLPLPKWAGRTFSLLRDDTPPWRLPPLKPWIETLRSSPLVGRGATPTPLVLDHRLRLYLYRYWAAEQRLSRRLRVLLDRPTTSPSPEVVERFRQLFPSPHDAATGLDHQAVAAALALDRGLCLISGGPGTGKTTTVSRILTLWLTAEPNLRIALAAPTGKAAARLGESIAQQVDGFDLPATWANRIPREAATLHRLLKYRRHQRRFLHRPGHPLPCDVLVVDEASMVDLLMMDVLVAALPRGARLVLLGDRDQLTSVETGFVFGDLVQGAQRAGWSSHFAEIFEELSGVPLPLDSENAPVPSDTEGTQGTSPLRDAAVELVTNYRFRHQPGIGGLAQAIRRQDIHGSLDVLDDADFTDAMRLQHATDARHWLAPVMDTVRHVFKASGPEEALELLGTFRILAVTRRGPWGVEQINRHVEDRLQKEGLMQTMEGMRAITERDDEAQPSWYSGRPIMITHNDYQVRLFNGDLGICWKHEGQLRAFFSDGQQSLRSLPLSKLPPHVTAWGMTVHKSQGSEFDHVLLVLPDKDSPLLGRELLYTAVTRAKRRVHVVTSASLLETAIQRRTHRASGLLDAVDPEYAENIGVAEPTEGAERPPVDPPSEPIQLSLFPET